MLEKVKKLLKDEEAPTAVEYGLMVAAVAMVVVVGALLLGKNVNDLFGATADKVKPAP